MTVKDMLERMTSREMCEWLAFSRLEAAEMKNAQALKKQSKGQGPKR